MSFIERLTIAKQIYHQLMNMHVNDVNHYQPNIVEHNENSHF
jgi:hypothetical protein